MVEVKSPSDSLSQQQVAWIDLLLRAGVRVDELRVQHEEATDYKATPPTWLGSGFGFGFGFGLGLGLG